MRRAEKSEVQNLIYGDNSGIAKNYMKQNYEELKQIQRETQQRMQQMQPAQEDRWVMKKFRDVKPKLARTGTLNDENSKEPESQKLDSKKSVKQQRSSTQDKRRDPIAPNVPKMTKAEKLRRVTHGRPLGEK